MLYGGDYNPDQWSEETWQEDVQLMQLAKVNIVSLGIFSWARLEPQPGVFDFAWLDRLMDLLHAHGIAVNLATPTASPPPWMVHLHPQILPVTKDGITLWHGSRRHYCPNNPDYRGYAARIAARLADHYKDHPALAMWHIDNEYGDECYCDNCAIAFRGWLKKRYTSLEKLNFTWGTAFWSQQYSEWDEIIPPRRAPTHTNPTQQLDWARFFSDSWLTCFHEQKAAISTSTPNIPVTTNFMSFFKGVDYFKFAKHEEIVSNDNYTDTSKPDWMAQAGMVCDLIRSVSKQQPWILMEQATSQVNWRQINTIKRPGVMRLGSMQAVARGADGIMFFQWRQSKAGAEKHHSAMLPHAGTDTRIWREITNLGSELIRLDVLLSSQVQTEVAILMDWENWWALELDSKPSSDLKLIPQLYSYYKTLFERNITVDFAHPHANLDHYKLVIAPNLYLLDDKAVGNINSYVKNGGRLIMGFFSGIVDENEHIRLGGYPAPFREMLGLLVEEYVPYPTGEGNTINTGDGKPFACTLWSDVIRTEGAQVLAKFDGDYYAGCPAITRHEFGNGLGYYVGCSLAQDGMDWLLGLVCDEAGVQPVASHIPIGVEALLRSSGEKDWLFLLNHTALAVEIPLNQDGRNLLTGETVSAAISLEKNGVAIIEIID